MALTTNQVWANTTNPPVVADGKVGSGFECNDADPDVFDWILKVYGDAIIALQSKDADQNTTLTDALNSLSQTVTSNRTAQVNKNSGIDTAIAALNDKTQNATEQRFGIAKQAQDTQLIQRTDDVFITPADWFLMAQFFGGLATVLQVERNESFARFIERDEANNQGGSGSAAGKDLVTTSSTHQWNKSANFYGGDGEGQGIYFVTVEKSHGSGGGPVRASVMLLLTWNAQTAELPSQAFASQTILFRDPSNGSVSGNILVTISVERTTNNPENNIVNIRLTEQDGTDPDSTVSLMRVSRANTEFLYSTPN